MEAFFYKENKTEDLLKNSIRKQFHKNHTHTSTFRKKCVHHEITDYINSNISENSRKTQMKHNRKTKCKNQ